MKSFAFSNSALPRIALLALVVLASLAACEARAQALWVSLREHPLKSVEIVDTITPEGDTLFLTIEVPDTLRRKPYLRSDTSIFKPLAPAPFTVTFRPIDSKVEFKSQYTAEAFRDSMVARNPMTPRKLDIYDPLGLTPMERAQLEYSVAHPSEVLYTWDQIPDPDKDVREGLKKNNDELNASVLREIFRPDNVSVSRDDIRRKEVKAPGPWKVSGQENMQFSQLAVSNWVKGGENSVALLHDLRLKALYAKGRSQWESSLTNKIGLTYTSALKGRVSDDAFDFSSKYGFNAVNQWYYSFLTTFKTQLFRNYASSDIEKKSPKSKFLSPAYIQLIFGMDYKKDNLSLLLSPYTGIITAVSDTALVDQTKYGVAKDKRANFVNGFSITANWKKNLYYGIDYTTRMELFCEYFKKDGNKRFDWENIIDVQINRFLSTRFLFQIRYFDNESSKFQVKENFTIAFKYSFQR